VVKAQMIKKGVHLNPLLKAEEQAGRDADIVLLQKALEKRLELEQLYQEAKNEYQAIIIDSTAFRYCYKISADDTKIRDLAVEYLSVQGITEQNGKLAVWLSGEKPIWKIFLSLIIWWKYCCLTAIALGWDCPRASVLLIYREMRNERFTVQTMGRILRMPEQSIIQMKH
jgi:type III restriction enzyme